MTKKPKKEKLNKMMKLVKWEGELTLGTRSSFKLQMSIATFSEIQRVLLSCRAKEDQLLTTCQSLEVEKVHDNHILQISLLLQPPLNQDQLHILLSH